MKTFFKVMGLIFTIGNLFLFKANIEEIRIMKAGHLVPVKLIKCSYDLERWGHRDIYIKFEYKGKVYVEKIMSVKGLTCEDLKQRDTLKLLTDDKYERFLYPEYNPYKQVFSGLLIELFGIYILYLGFSKKEISLDFDKYNRDRIRRL